MFPSKCLFGLDNWPATAPPPSSSFSLDYRLLIRDYAVTLGASISWPRRGNEFPVSTTTIPCYRYRGSGTVGRETVSGRAGCDAASGFRTGSTGDPIVDMRVLHFQVSSPSSSGGTSFWIRKLRPNGRIPSIGIPSRVCKLLGYYLRFARKWKAAPSPFPKLIFHTGLSRP